MANYYAVWRSNYFRVKDKEAFLKAIEPIPDLDVMFKPKKTKDGTEVEHCVLLASQVSDSGSIPWDYYNEDLEDFMDVDWSGIFKEHLQEHSVAVFMESGAEKLRYIVGVAHAFHSSGEMVTITLHDIYKEAQEAFGDEAIIETAQY
jgi:hypothetical protein